MTEADIHAWQEHTTQILAFIEAEGKVSKNSTRADSEFMIFGFDSSAVETIIENSKKRELYKLFFLVALCFQCPKTNKQGIFGTA